MADKKISALTAATTPLAGTEVLPIVQSGATVKVANNDLRPKQIQSNATSGVLQIAGPAAAATRVMTVPDANFTAARTDAAQSFTGDQTLSTGNLIQGTAAKGVNFTANTPAAGMTSQLLNWYEEGTWTPQYTNSTPPTTPYTMTITSATYTRIGRLVTIVANISTSNVNTTGASGTLRISGLPFTSAAHGVVNIGYAANWNTNFPSTGYVETGATTIALQYRATANGATAALNETNLVTGASAGQNQIIFTATYCV